MSASIIMYSSKVGPMSSLARMASLGFSLGFDQHGMAFGDHKADNEAKCDLTRYFLEGSLF